VDNLAGSVDNLGRPPPGAARRHPDTLRPSPSRATLNAMDEYDAERDGELLPAREVCALLHIARSTLPDWRRRGDLIGYKGRNGHWRYPSRQPALVEARAALKAAR
jgi:hypothetical protein